MPKPIALFDIDNTLYEGFSYFALLKKHADEGLITKQIPLDAHAYMQQYKSKLRDYETTMVELIDLHARGLKGVAYADVLASTQAFYNNSPKFYSYARPLITTLAPTHKLALVTGEPQFVAEAVGKVLNVPSFYSSLYEVVDGVFTGNVTRHLASRHEKHEAIAHLMVGHGKAGSFAFGDSEGDSEMLRAVEYGFCLNPTEGLRDIAARENFYTPSNDTVVQKVSSLL